MEKSITFIKGFDNGYPHEYLYWRNNGHQPYIENGVRARYIHTQSDLRIIKCLLDVGTQCF